MALDVLNNLVAQNLCTLSPHCWNRFRCLTLSQGPGQNRHSSFRLLVGFRNHTYSVEAQRIREDKATAILQTRQKGWEHRPVQTRHFLANIFGRHVLFESGIEGQVVKRYVPRHSNWVAGENNQADCTARKGLHLNRIG